MNIKILVSCLVISSLFSHYCHDGTCTVTHKRALVRQSHFYELVHALKNKHEKEVWQLLEGIAQQELLMQDYGGRTLLMIAIESGFEKIALHLVDLMDKQSLRIYEHNEQTALGYAYFYHMPMVADAISKKVF